MKSCEESKGIIAKKFFMCHFVRIEAICICKKHLLYFSGLHPHLIESDLNMISLWIKLLKGDKVFIIFEFLMNIKNYFHYFS